MSSNPNNNDDLKDELQENLGSEIFGQQVETTTDADDSESSTINDDIITSLNPDQNFEGEAISGANSTMSESQTINDNNLELVSDDIDADWQETSASEETSLAENPTPDQDQVESISQPWGTNYKSEEELDVEKKVRELEQDRENDEEKI